MRHEKVRLAALALAGIVAPGAAIAQAKFDVVSVKPCKAEDSGRGGDRGAGGGGGNQSPGRLDLKCRTVMGFLQLAYVQFADGKPRPQGPQGPRVPILGGPAWINSERFDIDGAAEGAPGLATMSGPMMQALLEDRFKLKIHRETRETPVYALTVAKGGAKLQAAQPGKCIVRDPDHPMPASQRPPGVWYCGVFTPSPTNDGSYMYGTTLANFCGGLSIVLDRAVIDKTGIGGVFDIHIPTDSAPGDPVGGAPRQAGPVIPASPTDALGSAIFAAVQKAGLKLEPAKGPGEFLVIDHVERPSEN